MLGKLPPFDPDKDRPYHERLLGERPSVPLIFTVAFDDGTLEDDALDEYKHTRPIRCRFCGESLTIVDTAMVCRQCRLEGRTK